MRRWTVDQTRELLLETGLEMLRVRGVFVGVTHIPLREVAQAAGYTVEAGYRCWDDEAAFHRDLALPAVARRDESPVAETVEAIDQLVKARAPLAEIIRAAAEANLFRLPEQTDLLNTMALRTRGPADEAMAKAGRERLTTNLEAFATLYTQLLRTYGLQMRAPYTVVDLTLALAALTEGFALQAMSGDRHPRVDRTDAGTGAERDWSLFGCAAEAIVSAFTEPDSDVRSGPH